jgi:hypothetical protein
VFADGPPASNKVRAPRKRRVVNLGVWFGSSRELCRHSGASRTAAKGAQVGEKLGVAGGSMLPRPMMSTAARVRLTVLAILEVWFKCVSRQGRNSRQWPPRRIGGLLCFLIRIAFLASSFALFVLCRSPDYAVWQAASPAQTARWKVTSVSPEQRFPLTAADPKTRDRPANLQINYGVNHT